MKQYFILFFLPVLLFGAYDLAVTNLQMTSPGDGRSNPAFVWDANIHANGYQISSDGGVHWIDVGKATEYTFNALSDGSHTVVVRAYVNNTTVPLFGAVGILALASLLGGLAALRLRRSRENGGFGGHTGL